MYTAKLYLQKQTTCVYICICCGHVFNSMMLLTSGIQTYVMKSLSVTYMENISLCGTYAPVAVSYSFMNCVNVQINLFTCKYHHFTFPHYIHSHKCRKQAFGDLYNTLVTACTETCLQQTSILLVSHQQLQDEMGLP